MSNLVKARIKSFVAVTIILFSFASLALAQTVEATVGEPKQTVSQILLDKIDWVINDIVRCVEELRRTDNQWEKRYLVEQVEDIFYREVEFPMLYQQVKSGYRMDVVPMGSEADITYGTDANPLAPKYAEAFALVGIAKGYEGYSAAATDYILRAQNIYKDVLSLKVKIDSFEDYKTLNQWMADSRSRWGGTQAVRLTFSGKNVAQDVIDGLNVGNVKFQTGAAIDEYYLYVAKRDFLKGIRTRIATDDPMKKDRENKFYVYLPPGKYKLVTDVGGEYGIDIEVRNDPNRNQFIIETIQNGIAVYPMPAMRDAGKLLQEKKEVTPEQPGTPGGDKGDSTGGGS